MAPREARRDLTYGECFTVSTVQLEKNKRIQIDVKVYAVTRVLLPGKLQIKT